MATIRPVTDLRNNFAEISRQVHETGEPVYLTKNGYGDMVVMSIEAFEMLKSHADVYFKLREAEMERKLTAKRYTQEEVFGGIRENILKCAEDESV